MALDSFIGSVFSRAQQRYSARATVPLELSIEDPQAPFSPLPRTLYAENSGVHNTECPVCLNSLLPDVTVVVNWPCGHVVCEGCAIELERRSESHRRACVVCRSTASS